MVSELFVSHQIARDALSANDAATIYCRIHR
jgi:hypothetical protein